MGLYDFSAVDAAANVVAWMRAVNDLTGGLWSIIASLLLFGLIVVGAYYKNRNWNKSLFGGSWAALVINLFFVWPIQLVTYKILFLYLVLLVIAYVSMKRDTSQ